MLDLDVMAERGLLPVTLVASGDGARVLPLDLAGLPPVVALLFGEAGDEKLHSKHLLM